MQSEMTYNDINISVIIPHYNSFETLVVLLDSIPDESDIEVVVIDDKSEDQALYDNIIYEFNNRNNVRFLKNICEKKGAGTCRNIGLDNVSGKWIVFADADDFFMPDAFKCFSRHIQSNADIIYFNATSIYLDTHEMSNRHDKFNNVLHYHLNKQTPFSELLLKIDSGEPVCKMIRRGLVCDNELRFEEIMVANDIMFGVKVAIAAQRIEAYDEVVYCITQSSESLTQYNTLERSKIRLEADIRVCKYMKQMLSKSDFSKSGRCGIYFIISGLKQYGIRYAIRVMKQYRINKIPIFQPYILRNYWIEYHNRL